MSNCFLRKTCKIYQNVSRRLLFMFNNSSFYSKSPTGRQRSVNMRAALFMQKYNSYTLFIQKR